MLNLSDLSKNKNLDQKQNTVFNSSQLNLFFCSLTPLSLPFKDVQGRTIQIWKFHKDKLVGSVVDSQENVVLISGKSIFNALYSQDTSTDLIFRLESVALRTWGIVYDDKKRTLTIWPLLKAEGRFLQIFEKKGFEASFDSLNSHLQKLKLEPLNHEHYLAFRREKKGLPIIGKKDGMPIMGKKGSPINHIKEVEQGQTSAKKLISDIKGILSKDIKPEERQKLVDLLSKASTMLDESSKMTLSFPKPLKKPAEKDHVKTVQATRLVKDSNASNPNNPMPDKGMTSGKIGGVACSYEYIDGLFDNPESLFESQHYFCVQTDGKIPFTNEELRQIIRELSIGIYAHGTIPFFSLHFRQETADLFPVIHPAYQNTLVGRVISMLDYFMKGYLNGGVFTEKFIDGWHKNPDWISQHESALQELIDFQSYCLQLKGEDQKYASLKSITESFSSTSFLKKLFSKFMNTEEKSESQVLSEFEGFKNSFRIIAKQKSFQKSGNVFVIDADFDVEYTIVPSPGYTQELENYQRLHGDLPFSYQRLVAAFELMKTRIHNHMQKLPFCKPYFSMLGVIHFLACYISTLKKHNKMPDLSPILDLKTKGCPPLFPHLPITIQDKEPLRLNMKKIIRKVVSTISYDVFDKCFKNLYSHFKHKKPVEEFEFEKLNDVLQAFAKAIEANILKNCSIPFRKFIENNKKELWFVEMISEIAKGLFDQCAKAFGICCEHYWSLPSDRRIDRDKMRSTFISKLKEMFEGELIEFSKPIPYQSTVINSEAPKEALEKNKRIVGGCGLRMEQKQVQYSPVGGEIERLHWKKLASMKPETWELIDVLDSKKAVFGLKLGDVPADLSDDYGWMETYLLTTPEDPEMELAQGMILLQEAMEEKVDKNTNFEKQVNTFKPEGLQKMRDREGASLLAYAATHENPLYLKTLLPKISPLQADKYGYLPIHYAAMKNRLELVKELHVKVPDSLKMRSLNHSTPLTVAILHEAKSVVQYCLDHHPVLTELTDGYTDLHCVLHVGNLDIISLFLKYDKAIQPCINVCSEEGGTPLMIACELDEPGPVKTLLEKGANVDFQRKDGITAMAIAVKRRCFPVFEILLEKAKLTHALIETVLQEGSMEMVEEFSAKHKNFDAYIKSNGETAVHIAIRHGNLPALFFLAQQFPDLFKKKNKEGQLPLNLLVKVNAWDVLDILFTKHGIIPDVMELLEANFHPTMEKMLNKLTLDPSKLLDYLKIAGRSGNHRSVSCLLNHPNLALEKLSQDIQMEVLSFLAISDATSHFEKIFSKESSIKFKLDGQKTLAYLAAENNSFRVLFFLLSWMKDQKISLQKNNQDRHLFYPLIVSGHVKAIELALSMFPECVNISLDNRGMKPLHLAIEMGLKEVASILIAKGALTEGGDSNAPSCLSIAILQRQEEMVDLLLNKKATVEAFDLYEAAKEEDNILSILLNAKPAQKLLDHALYLAVESHDRMTALRLRSKGASYMHVQSGMTLMLLASKTGQSEILVEVIHELSKQAPHQLKLVNEEGNNALHVACQNGHVGCVLILLESGFDPQSKNGKGKSAIDLAQDKKFLSLLLKSPKEGKATLENFMQALESSNLQKIEATLDSFSGNEMLPYRSGKELLHATPLHLALLHTNNFSLEFVIIWLKNRPLCANLADSKGERIAHLLVRKGISPLKVPFLDLKACNHKKQTVLHVAAKEKVDEYLFQDLMKGVENIDIPDAKGKTPLFYCIEAKDEKKVALLIKGKVSLDKMDNKRNTPLLLAIQLGLLSCVKLLVEGGADINETGMMSKVTPLLLSVVARHHEISRYLLFKGARIDIAGEGDYLPIHAAAAEGDIELFRLVSLHRQSLLASNNQGKRAVHFAALHGHTEIMGYIQEIDKKAFDCRLELKKNRDEEGTMDFLDNATPLHLAALSNNPGTVDWFLKNGANPEAVTRKKQLPLHFGTKSQAAQAMFQLFEPYALTEKIDNLLSSALNVIAQDHVDAMKSIYAKGIPVNWEIAGQKTSGLHMACYSGSLQCTAWFLHHGANPALTDDEGKNAFEIAASKDFHEQFKLLLYYSRPDLDETYSHGQTLLHIAANHGKLKNVIILLKLGASLNIKDQTGSTPLHYAARENRVEIAQLLLIMGADRTIKSEYGKIPKDYASTHEMKTVFDHFEIAIKQSKSSDSRLHLASRVGNKWAAQLLLEDEEEVDTKNSSGHTPLHVAVEGEHEEIAFILLSKGANPLVKDEKGESPISLAKKKPHF